MDPKLFIAIIAGLVPMIGWGIADIIAKKAVDTVGSIASLFWVETFGAILLGVLMFIIRPVIVITTQDFLLLIIFSITSAIGYYLLYKGLEKGLVSVVSPVLYSYGGISVLVFMFFFGEVISPLRCVALAMIFVGVIVISTDFKQLFSLSQKKIAKGIPEAFTAMIIFGFWYPYWDRFVAGKDTLFLVFVIRTIGAITLFILAKNEKTKIKIKQNWLWPPLIVVGCIEAFAYIAITWGNKMTSYPSIIALLSSASPLPTLILASLFLKEKINKSQLFGAFSVIVGLILLGMTG